MSSLTDLFSAMANKIRSKTGTQTLYTPAQMVSDGIDDVYTAGYDAGGGGGGSGMPITPSNATPVSLESGEIYQPTANGYAIESYSSVTPSNSSPVSLISGSIYKAGGAGYAIASNPTTLTPSNASPPSIASNTIYKGGGSGYAISSYNSIAPSSSSPVSLSSGSIYKPSSSGYAIDSYSSISPSSSGTYFSSGMKKMNSSGYAYDSQQSVCKVGTATLSGSATTTVTLGFKPKYLAIRITNSSQAAFVVNIYDERYSTSSYFYASTSGYLGTTSTGTTTNNRLNSVTSTGFIINKVNTSYTSLYYFAIG